MNNYGDVSDATRKRVLELAKELDYTPSAAARTLVTRRSHVVGVVLSPGLRHPFFQEVLYGLRDRLGAAGFDLLIFAADHPGNGFGYHDYLKRCQHHRLDGVALMGVDRHDPEVHGLLRSKWPCVFVDLDLSGTRAGYVMSDNYGGAEVATKHLLSLGHRRIGHLHGPLGSRPSTDRVGGYRAALEGAGLAFDPALVLEGDDLNESGYACMQALLALDEPPTALFASSDLMAVGAMLAAFDAGLRVPQDLAVVGFDDIPIASLLRPALTTVRQDKEGLGRAAAEALVRAIEEPEQPPSVITLPVELVVRESCGA